MARRDHVILIAIHKWDRSRAFLREPPRLS